MENLELRQKVLAAKGIVLPTASTLRKYGLSLEEYVGMLADQNWRCPICHRSPPEVKLVTDHEHKRGWKKMPPSRRREFVRGLPCVHCNFRFLPIGLDSMRAARIATYLLRYENKRNTSSE